MSAQPGIFALGTPEHSYLELDLKVGADAADLLTRLVGLADLLSSSGGASVVLGVRPELWARLAPDQAPVDAAGWNEELAGPDGFSMPATQHDVWVWIAAGTRTTVFDLSRRVLTAVRDLATVASEVSGWIYRHDRDLTGFIDGTENPSLLEAPAAALVPPGQPGADCSIVLHQLWRQDPEAWTALGDRGQELAMGRTKADSVELDEEVMPPSAHVARTKVVVDGEELPIFRRNVAYGGATDHGTVFVGFAADQWRLAQMLRQMAGVTDGIRCELTRYAQPVSGAYYVAPALEALARWGAAG